MLHNSKLRILVFGTFDGIHKGHLDFFKQARKLTKNSFLIASVATDKNVKKVKGRLPLRKQAKRILDLKKLNVVDKVVLGEEVNFLKGIKMLKPSIIALGYDQKAYTLGLKTKLKHQGLSVKVVRLSAFKPKIYKSSLINKKV